MRIHNILFLLTISMALAGLPQTAPADDIHHWVNYKWLSGSPALPQQALVLPIDIEVVEGNAGGVDEKVPEWSKEAGQSVFNALTAALGKHGVKGTAMPRLPETMIANIDEHVALYKLVVNTAVRSNWKHKVKRFDYSIGPGLREVADKTGVDVAFLVYGRDFVTTAGRKVRAVTGRIPFVNAITGAPLELGHSFVHVGAVDLRTGDILWMNSSLRKGSTNLRDPSDAAKMINTIFEDYPGIDDYRKNYAR